MSANNQNHQTAKHRARLAQALRNVQATLARVTNPRRARDWIGVSQPELGRRFGALHPNGRAGRPLAGSTISHIELGHYVIPYQRDLYERALNAQAQSETESVLTLKLNGTPRKFRVVFYRACAECGKEFRLERSNQVRCKRCRK